MVRDVSIISYVAESSTRPVPKEFLRLEEAVRTQRSGTVQGEGFLIRMVLESLSMGQLRSRGFPQPRLRKQNRWRLKNHKDRLLSLSIKRGKLQSLHYLISLIQSELEFRSPPLESISQGSHSVNLNRVPSFLAAVYILLLSYSLHNLRIENFPFSEMRMEGPLRSFQTEFSHIFGHSCWNSTCPSDAGVGVYFCHFHGICGSL